LAASCGGGRIEFKSFSSLLRKISEIPPLPDKTAEGAGDGGGDTLLEGGAKAPEKLIEKIKKHMVRYHPQGVNMLFRVFRGLDREKTGSVSHANFYAGLKQCGLRLGTEEVESLLNYFDFNRDGSVTYELFLDLLRGPVPSSRIEACEALWAKVAGSAKDVSAMALAEGYNADLHPSVLAGKATAEKKREEFLEYCGEYLLLGSVPKDVVLNFFVDEGVSIADDQEFQDYLQSAFPEAGAAA